MQLKSTPSVMCLLLISVLGQNSGNPTAPGSQSTQTAGPEAIASLGLAPPHYQADFTPVIADGRHWLSWDKGYLVNFVIGGSGLVTVYDKSGKWLFEDPLTFENAVKVFIQDATATSLGNAVAAASVVNKDGATADMIVKVSKDGIRTAVRTNPFYPIKVCATGEGTVWAYGMEMNPDRLPAHRLHYPMLREYSFEKGELRTALDRPTVRPQQGVTLKGGSGQELQMMCTKEKVVIVNGVISELEEYDLAASTLSRWPIRQLPERFYINGAAITDSGEIYVSVLKQGQNALTGILHLHLNSSGTVDWTPLTITPPGERGFFHLFGSDGEDLVHSRGLNAPTLFWSKAGEPGVTK